MIDYSNIVYEYVNKNKELPFVYTFTHKDNIFIGLNTVFSPMVFEDSFWFADNLPFKQNGSFLEIGCGTGLISIVAVQKGCNKVLATDLNPDAVKNTKLNVTLFNFEKVISTQVSNVFQTIGSNFLNKFSLIFWNTPFIYTQNQNLDNLEKSVFDYDYKAISEYIENVKLYLEPNGKCFLGFSSSSGNIELLKTICKRFNCYLRSFSHYTFDDGFRVELFEIKFSND